MKLWNASSIILLAALAFPQETFKFSVTTNLVVVNVEVKDKPGRPVEGLSREDFEVLEDGRPQSVSVFEYQRLETAAPLPPPQAPPTAVAAGESPAPPAPEDAISASKPGEVRYRDRRLIVLYFDLSSMGVPEQIRARDGALEFMEKNMAPNDLVAIMTFSSQLRVLQDFTNDRDQLQEAIDSLRIGETSELSESEAVDESVEDTGADFIADNTEFDIFNTDRKLSALQTAADMLASLPEKKALVYFSSGASRTGTENESQLRSTVNAAVRANVAFYPVDARGLVAEAPGGDARVGSIRGSAMYSGQAQRQRRSKFEAQQETLFTLAADTGGEALLDNNQLSLGIVQAQQDIASYYILGYYSTNPAEDGKYRRVQVRVKSRPGLRLDYRTGYFGPKRFEQFTEADRERQLEEALALEDPITDLTLALEVNYFLRGRDRYIVPVSVKIPGSEVQLARRRNREEARLDFIARVTDQDGAVAGTVRDFIKIQLKGENKGTLDARQIQYDTAFTLPPGEYTLKMLVRENETGQIGTFQSRFAIPNLVAEKEYLRLSSVVWAGQREPVKAAIGAVGGLGRMFRTHPMVHDGQKLIPSITKVFRQGQELFVFFEVYEPGKVAKEEQVDVAASLSVFGRNGKEFESEPVEITSKLESRFAMLPLQLRVPLQDLAPGRYLCQLNVIDRAGKKFAFSRARLVVLPARDSEAD